MKEKKPLWKRNPWIKFFVPNKWKLAVGVGLYFSNYITFFGTIINFPIFYFYWNYTMDGFGLFVLFISHLIYAYLLSCLLVKFFSK